MAELDAEYLRLYRRYAEAIRDYDKAVKRRREFRNRLTVKRTPMMQAFSEWERRKWQQKSAALRPRPKSRVRGPVVPTKRAGSGKVVRIWMGPILGYARLTGTPSPKVAGGPEPGSNLDLDSLADQISLKIYWNVKARHEKAKRAFFDYARRQQIEVHHERAREALDYGANLQYLGVEDTEDAFEEARAEVEKACEIAVKIYKQAPSPKSLDMKIFLIGHLADAQFVGLDGSKVDEDMNTLLSESFENYGATGTL